MRRQRPLVAAAAAVADTARPAQYELHRFAFFRQSIPIYFAFTPLPLTPDLYFESLAHRNGTDDLWRAGAVVVLHTAVYKLPLLGSSLSVETSDCRIGLRKFGR